MISLSKHLLKLYAPDDGAPAGGAAPGGVVDAPAPAPAAEPAATPAEGAPPEAAPAPAPEVDPWESMSPEERDVQAEHIRTLGEIFLKSKESEAAPSPDPAKGEESPAPPAPAAAKPSLDTPPEIAEAVEAIDFSPYFTREGDEWRDWNENYAPMMAEGFKQAVGMIFALNRKMVEEAQGKLTTLYETKHTTAVQQFAIDTAKDEFLKANPEFAKLGAIGDKIVDAAISAVKTEKPTFRQVDVLNRLNADWKAYRKTFAGMVAAKNESKTPTGTPPTGARTPEAASPASGQKTADYFRKLIY